MSGDTPTAGLSRVVSMGLQVAGSGIGAMLGAQTGDPLAAAIGAMAGTSIGEVGGELADRFLSPRQEVRVGAVFLQAGAAMKVLELSGKTIRDDDFWVGEHRYGYEFAEGVMRAAMDSYEERKLPYLANLLANVSFEKNVDAATANLALRLAQDMTWTELMMLGLFWSAEEYGNHELPDLPKETHLESWFDATVHETYVGLSDRRGLIAHPRTVTVPDRIATFDLSLKAVQLTNPGRLVAGLMDLQQIPQVDLAKLWEALARPGPESPSDQGEPEN